MTLNCDPVDEDEEGGGSDCGPVRIDRRNRGRSDLAVALRGARPLRVRHRIGAGSCLSCGDRPPQRVSADAARLPSRDGSADSPLASGSTKGRSPDAAGVPALLVLCSERGSGGSARADGGWASSPRATVGSSSTRVTHGGSIARGEAELLPSPGRWETDDEAEWRRVLSFPQFGVNLVRPRARRADGRVPRRGRAGGLPGLARRCVLLVEGEERPLTPWDFVHCPPVDGAHHRRRRRGPERRPRGRSAWSRPDPLPVRRGSDETRRVERARHDRRGRGVRALRAGP